MILIETINNEIFLTEQNFSVSDFEGKLQFLPTEIYRIMYRPVEIDAPGEGGNKLTQFEFQIARLDQDAIQRKQIIINLRNVISLSEVDLNGGFGQVFARYKEQTQLI
jgi:hypothetical protein